MATLVLSAVGMAAGGSIGGTVAGLSMAVIGRAAGAMVGRVIDQRLLGAGSQAVETGRVDRFRITGASEGKAIGQVYGRMRVGGQVIWATRFLETASTSGGGGGKGAPSGPSVTQYSYSVSLAVALSEGTITNVGRVWADGVEVAPDDLNMRIYTGADDQQPDPKIVAVEGAENVPAFRGTAYVVFEDLDLSQFGNRVPQFSFEVTRPSEDMGDEIAQDLAHCVTGVAMMPGSGEYTLATTPVYFDEGQGQTRPANINTASGKSDLQTSLDNLNGELPKCQSTSLVVSWFGNDLRCTECELKPKIEQDQTEGSALPWTVSGLNRSTAEVVTYIDDRPAYGGTPTDQSVIEAIQEIQERGQSVLFYPFILMDQDAANGLPDPWSAATDQPKFPWRGRITTSAAPGEPGSPDQTAAAIAEVDAFFGAAQPGDFNPMGQTVSYSGPPEWTYRRFILHYAHLCALAGGVEAFCIGSEMRSMTQVRSAANQFPTVTHLIQLAADVRGILGPDTKISYAADWSEYFGYQPQDGTHDRYFHLDPLWADPNIDFIGIDNYMPLSDWRDGCEHLDFAGAGSIYNLDYLMANVEGGEGFEWYYPTPESRAAQFREPIQDASQSEPWAFRYKDIRGWWKNPHYNRIGGVRSLTETDWVPEMKPIWFTEIGCAAVDKATNQPNKFLDPKSSESTTPYYSDGRRDELIQMQYLRAMYSHWNMPANNPISSEYEGPMLNMDRAHVWAWDARPFPAFPSLLNVWSDGANYTKGHWLTGRAAARPLDSVVREICARSGLYDIDTSNLYGYVRGYSIPDVGSGRSALQPLMLAYGFDVLEREGVLIFRNRTGKTQNTLLKPEMVIGPDTPAAIEYTRQPEAEIADRVRLNYVQADGSFEIAASESVFPSDDTKSIAVTDLNLALTPVEAQQITERWLAESRLARDTAKFALPPSRTPLGAGDVVAIAEPGGVATFRMDRVEMTEDRLVEAVRIEDNVYDPLDLDDPALPTQFFVPPAPVFPMFLDIPLMSGDEVPHAPHLAITADPWPGSAATYSSATDSNYQFNTVSPAPAALGLTLDPLAWAQPGIFDNGPVLEVQLTQGALSSAQAEAMLAGANLAAIGDGTVDNWELFQFEDATVVGPNTFQISRRLRGQQGTDALMPAVWPAGSTFVLLDSAVQQVDMALSARTIAQHYRIGPAQRPHTDPSYGHISHAFQGNGLRPYAPVWFQASQGAAGLDFTWVRRTRLHGDPWDLAQVPLMEAFESYHIQIFQGATVIREDTVSTPSWTYSTAMQAADGVSGSAFVRVAQVSEIYGPGLYRDMTVML